MSHNIVLKASNVTRERVDARLNQDPEHLRDLGTDMGHEHDVYGVISKSS